MGGDRPSTDSRDKMNGNLLGRVLNFTGRCPRPSTIVHQIQGSTRFSTCIRRSAAVSFRPFSTSTITFKVHKKTEKEKASVREEPLQSTHSLLKAAYKEMTVLELILHEELDRHFSLKTDLRSFEDITVKLKDGTTHKLNHLARITLKSPQLISVSFVENPGAIGPARDAILRSAMNVNPQQEGVVLHIPVPRMTKERREQLAVDARHKVLNDYREQLNRIYTRHDKQNQKETKSQDCRVALQSKLLAQKKIYENNARITINSRAEELFKEVA